MIKQHRNGFTLIETIFSLMLFMIIVSFIPSLYKVIEINVFNDNQESMSWELFANQSKKEFRSVESFAITDQKLVMLNGAMTITYELYRNVLRRQVNGTGHEVLLQNVQSVLFEKLNGGVKLTIVDESGEKYETKLYSNLHLVKERTDE